MPFLDNVLDDWAAPQTCMVEDPNDGLDAEDDFEHILQLL